MSGKKEIFAGKDLPDHIEAVRASIEDGLTEEEYNDQHYAYRVLYVPKVVNKKSQADEVVEFVPAESDEAAELNKVYLKEVDKPRYRPGLVVQKMKDEGFGWFGMMQHTDLWKALDARKPGKGYGVETESDGWRWYERWVDVVRAYCEANRERYE